LTSDIYPGDFGWGVNWDKPEERQEWYHNMSSVMQAGPCVRSNQLDYDEDVMFKVRSNFQSPKCGALQEKFNFDQNALAVVPVV